MAVSSFTYASGLELTKITPTDGETGKQVSNMAIKMTFSAEMATEDNVKANEKNFVITGADGKKVPFYPVYDAEKYPNDIWLILEQDLASDSEYTVTIKADLKSVDGQTLGKDITSTFFTRNVKTDSNVSMLLTFGMMGVMFYSTSKMTKKATEKQKVEQGDPEMEMNPYKIAKEKNISVQEAVTIVEKEKAKAEKAAKKKEKKAAVVEETYDDTPTFDYDEELGVNTYKVKARASVKETGHHIPKAVNRRIKEKKEAERLAEERRKANSAGKKKKK
ncbi:MAG: Ig-like domain-containing protein, partial [Firmicutes bacterium]|nr:Ig-like domain-containing protein [Bacillota bacterium]